MPKYPTKQPSTAASGETGPPPPSKEASSSQYYQGPEDKTNLKNIHLLAEKHQPWLNGFLKTVHNHHLDQGQEPTEVVASWLRLRDDLGNDKFHEHSSANVAALLSLQTAVSGTRSTTYIEELTGLSSDQVQKFLVQSLINQPIKTSRSPFLGVEKNTDKLTKHIQSELDKDQLILRTALLPDHLLGPLEKHDLQRAITGKTTGRMFKEGAKKAQAESVKKITLPEAESEEISVAQFNIDDPKEFRRFVGQAEAARSLEIIKSRQENLQGKAEFEGIPKYLQDAVSIDNTGRIFTTCLKDQRSPAGDWNKSNVTENMFKLIHPDMPTETTDKLDLLAVSANLDSKLKTKLINTLNPHLSSRIDQNSSLEQVQSAIKELTSSTNQESVINNMQASLLKSYQNGSFFHRADIAMDYLDSQVAKAEIKANEFEIPEASKIFESLRADSLKGVTIEQLFPFIAAGISIENLQGKGASIEISKKAAETFFVMDLDEDPPILKLDDEGLPTIKTSHLREEFKKLLKDEKTADYSKTARKNIKDSLENDDDEVTKRYEWSIEIDLLKEIKTDSGPSLAEAISPEKMELVLEKIRSISTQDIYKAKSIGFDPKRIFGDELSSLIKSPADEINLLEKLDLLKKEYLTPEGEIKDTHHDYGKNIKRARTAAMDNSPELQRRIKAEEKRLADQAVLEFTNEHMLKSTLNRVESIDLAALIDKEQLPDNSVTAKKQKEIDEIINSSTKKVDPAKLQNYLTKYPQTFSGLGLAGLLMILGDTISGTLKETSHQNKSQFEALFS